ncbi:hypothetical protein QQX98_006520 [Neonectria punicea]|uniref:HNH nuclease domain-containing protein n=1 Tax=Neonectria punicea TaxID=979145 RepID=A0ABR1H147_9HYPO
MSEPTPASEAEKDSTRTEREKTLSRFLDSYYKGPDSDTLDRLRAQVVDASVKSLEDPNVTESDLRDMLLYHETPHDASPSTSAYEEDIVERMRILEYLATTPIRQNEYYEPERIHPHEITPLTWAAFIVAPIEQLKALENKVLNGDVLELSTILRVLKFTLPELALIWQARATSDPTKKQTRNPRSKKTTLERDGGLCVLLGSPDAEACHLYPVASIQHASHFGTLLNDLSSIWGSQRIAAYKKRTGEHDIDIPQNMLALNCLIHHWMDNMKVTFEPIVELCTATTLVLRYRWLQDSEFRVKTRNQKRKREEEGVELHTHPNRILKPFDKKYGVDVDYSSVHFKTQKRIKDGYRLTITTKDPVKFPLPSIDLLQLHYQMARMIALAGAAEPDEDEFEDPDADSVTEAVTSTRGDEDKVDEMVAALASRGELDYGSHPLWEARRGLSPATPRHASHSRSVSDHIVGYMGRTTLDSPRSEARSLTSVPSSPVPPSRG